jgi:uncharacterized repeat protein (TIGR03843 family)
MRPPQRTPQRGALSPTLLTEGEVTLEGRLPWSSNGTFLVQVARRGETARAVYKPLAGERPLWDYPAGLYQREVGAYLVSERLGWGLVPETVVREGPLGVGSVQRFVEADFEEHYFTLLERPEHHDTLKAICAFDLVVNNGDRKSGHCLIDQERRIWGIDHGLCLHPHPKLRTVMWDFGGQPIPPERVEDIARLAADLASGPGELADVVSPVEIEALVARAKAVVRKPFFPVARSGRSFPWPLV